MSSKTKTVLKLMIPSPIGIILFLVPVNYRGESEIVVGIIANGLKSALGGALIPLLTILTVGSAALSLLHRICPLPFFSRHEALNRLFSPNLFWLVVRTLGGAITLLVFFRLGPAAVWSADTGGNMLTTICLLYTSSLTSWATGSTITSPPGRTAGSSAPPPLCCGTGRAGSSAPCASIRTSPSSARRRRCSTASPATAASGT